MEFLLLGWMVQLAMGVAFWVLPRFGVGPPRGDVRLIWLAFFLLNGGIWLVVLQPLIFPPWAALIGRLSEAVGVLAFALGSWRWVRPSGA